MISRFVQRAIKFTNTQSRFYSTPLFFTILNKNTRCKTRTYLVGCPKTKEAAIIDPIEPKIERYLGYLAYTGYKLTHVIDTHSHADHLTGAIELKELLPEVKTVMHYRSPSPIIDQHVEDGDTLKVGELDFRILYTPGHTPDSISIYVHDRVFTGDALLIGGCGRTDFSGGDVEQLYESITEKLWKLPESTLVYPGHDYRGNEHSTIGKEKETNPRVKVGTTKEQFVEIMNNLNLPLPKGIQEVLQPNQSAIDDDTVKFPDLASLNSVLQLEPKKVKEMMEDKNIEPVIIDVREPQELKEPLTPIPGSLNIPLKEITSRLPELEKYKERPIILVCRAGVRSTTAAALLNGSNMGFKQVFNLKGGLIDWHKTFNKSQRN